MHNVPSRLPFKPKLIDSTQLLRDAFCRREHKLLPSDNPDHPYTIVDHVDRSRGSVPGKCQGEANLRIINDAITEFAEFQLNDEERTILTTLYIDKRRRRVQVASEAQKLEQTCGCESNSKKQLEELKYAVCKRRSEVWLYLENLRSLDTLLVKCLKKVVVGAKAEIELEELTNAVKKRILTLRGETRSIEEQLTVARKQIDTRSAEICDITDQVRSLISANVVDASLLVELFQFPPEQIKDLNIVTKRASMEFTDHTIYINWLGNHEGARKIQALEIQRKDAAQIRENNAQSVKQLTEEHTESEKQIKKLLQVINMIEEQLKDNRETTQASINETSLHLVVPWSPTLETHVAGDLVNCDLCIRFVDELSKSQRTDASKVELVEKNSTISQLHDRIEMLKQRQNELTRELEIERSSLYRIVNEHYGLTSPSPTSLEVYMNALELEEIRLQSEQNHSHAFSVLKKYQNTIDTLNQLLTILSVENSLHFEDISKFISKIENDCKLLENETNRVTVKRGHIESDLKHQLQDAAMKQALISSMSEAVNQELELLKHGLPEDSKVYTCDKTTSGTVREVNMRSYPSVP